ncbi:MAG: hypothetical protein GY773_04225 [Actinomycetia bacterium]|nr:hypothetical protein [Actinomycetes bacterium]
MVMESAAEALLAIGNGERDRALSLVEAGSVETGSVEMGSVEAEGAGDRGSDRGEAGGALAAALARFLRSYSGRGDDDAGPAGVCVEPSAFEAFIDNGDNPNLYASTIDALATRHAELAPRTVLDIGCGDGRVTAGAMAAGPHDVGPGGAPIVDLVEPSEPDHQPPRRLLLVGDRSPHRGCRCYLR